MWPLGPLTCPHLDPCSLGHKLSILAPPLVVCIQQQSVQGSCSYSTFVPAGGEGCAETVPLLGQRFL
jgi:hypothetical protein